HGAPSPQVITSRSAQLRPSIFGLIRSVTRPVFASMRSTVEATPGAAESSSCVSQIAFPTAATERIPASAPYGPDPNGCSDFTIFPAGSILTVIAFGSPVDVCPAFTAAHQSAPSAAAPRL